MPIRLIALAVALVAGFFGVRKIRNVRRGRESTLAPSPEVPSDLSSMEMPREMPGLASTAPARSTH